MAEEQEAPKSDGEAAGSAAPETGEKKKPSSLRGRVDRKQRAFATRTSMTKVLIFLAIVIVAAAGLAYAFFWSG